MRQFLGLGISPPTRRRTWGWGCCVMVVSGWRGCGIPCRWCCVSSCRCCRGRLVRCRCWWLLVGCWWLIGRGLVSTPRCNCRLIWRRRRVRLCGPRWWLCGIPRGSCVRGRSGSVLGWGCGRRIGRRCRERSWRRVCTGSWCRCLGRVRLCWWLRGVACGAVGARRRIWCWCWRGRGVMLRE